MRGVKRTSKTMRLHDAVWDLVDRACARTARRSVASYVEHAVLKQLARDGLTLDHGDLPGYVRVDEAAGDLLRSVGVDVTDDWVSELTDAEYEAAVRWAGLFVIATASRGEFEYDVPTRPDFLPRGGDGEE